MFAQQSKYLCDVRIISKYPMREFQERQNYLRWNLNLSSYQTIAFSTVGNSEADKSPKQFDKRRMWNLQSKLERMSQISQSQAKRKDFRTYPFDTTDITQAYPKPEGAMHSYFSIFLKFHAFFFLTPFTIHIDADGEYSLKSSKIRKVL